LSGDAGNLALSNQLSQIDAYKGHQTLDRDMQGFNFVAVQAIVEALVSAVSAGEVEASWR
jgi:hypothetical protein